MVRTPEYSNPLSAGSCLNACICTASEQTHRFVTIKLTTPTKEWWGDVYPCEGGYEAVVEAVEFKEVKQKATHNYREPEARTIFCMVAILTASR